MAMPSANTVRKNVCAFGERLRDGSLQEDGLAEIAVSELAQPIRELHRQRPIQSVSPAQRGDVGGGCLFAEHHRRRIAGGEPRDDEHKRRDDQHHDDHPGEA